MMAQRDLAVVPHALLGTARLVAAAALACQFFFGCTATIEMNDGRLVEGCIRCSDREALYVSRVQQGLRCGCDSSVRVPRADVRDIDHPGTTAVVAGVSIIGTNAALFSAGAITFGEEHILTVASVTGGFSVLGTVVMSVGWWSWARSTEAAEIPPYVRNCKDEAC